MIIIIIYQTMHNLQVFNHYDDSSLSQYGVSTKTGLKVGTR